MLNDLFNIYPYAEGGGAGGGGGRREEGSQEKRQFLVFEHKKISESAQRNRIFSKPLSRVM